MCQCVDHLHLIDARSSESFGHRGVVRLTGRILPRDKILQSQLGQGNFTTSFHIFQHFVDPNFF